MSYNSQHNLMKSIEKYFMFVQHIYVQRRYLLTIDTIFLFPRDGEVLQGYRVDDRTSTARDMGVFMEIHYTCRYSCK